MPALVLAVVLAVACGREAGAPVPRPSASGSPTPALSTIRGVLVALHPGSLTDAGRFTVRTAEGDEMTFQFAPGYAGAPDHPMSPGHLQVHLLTREPVTVTYRDEHGVHLATVITD